MLARSLARSLAPRAALRAPSSSSSSSSFSSPPLTDGERVLADKLRAALDPVHLEVEDISGERGRA